MRVLVTDLRFHWRDARGSAMCGRPIEGALWPVELAVGHGMAECDACAGILRASGWRYDLRRIAEVNG